MKGRGLLAGLLVSLALNLFLIGAGAGVLIYSRAVPQAVSASGPPPRAPLRAMAESLAPEHRAPFRASVRRSLDASLGDVQEARRLRAEAYDLMSAPNFDPAAVLDRLDRARGLEMGARRRVEADMIAYSATLQPAERASMAETMRLVMERMRSSGVLQLWGASKVAAVPPTPDPQVR